MVNYVIIGGGVAGVCCAEELCRICPEDSVTLVAVDRILKVPPLLQVAESSVVNLEIWSHSFSSMLFHIPGS